ncbi:hypothetical protein BGZ95_008712 [Linnemannia exigua]|uniref:C2H2-type domain-containing protein n=1 Tax=Linnemannia exigua TaxID=604196 RepID=A0AAD4H757_9FUNG|nr:hypothetical protein BGZ95_008712 [Linnemannia exigua]
MPGHSLQPMDQFHPQAIMPQHHQHHQQHQQQSQSQYHHQQPQPSADDLAALAALARPITLSLSRFSRECTAGVVFSLQDSNQVLAPWNSIYIPKHYRVPIPGQRQSSPGECDLVLKIFPRLETTDTNVDNIKMQELVMPCDRCRSRKRDIFQIVGPDPTAPSPQRLFFSTGEIRLFFKICCPPGHHTTPQESASYVLTFELHHGKRILMSETVRNAGPGLFPDPAPTLIEFGAGAPRPSKRRMSMSPPPFDQESDHTLSRKRSAIMSLDHLISANAASNHMDISAPSSASTLTDPHSPTAVVPSSPNSYHDESGMRSRTKSMSFEDQAPASWSYGKGSRSGSERAEDIPPNQHKSNGNSTKPTKKRQEPHELSELGIGQRASANLHAAYVSSQLKELSKAGLPTDGVVLPEGANKPKNNKPKPSHACPEPECDKSFSRLFNLRSHMRTHSKARPFVCESCQFAFSRRHDRDRHAKKHLSEKPYKCIVCEATFVRQDALVRHLRMDGVLNQCMAAMEQRALQLGENNNGYMLAAKQQAHDEQQLEDRRDADGNQGTRQVNGVKKLKNEDDGEGAGHANIGAGAEGEFKDVKSLSETAPEANVPTPAASSSTTHRQTTTVDPSIASNRDGVVPPVKGAFSRPPSPRHKAEPNPTSGAYDGHPNYDAGKPHSYAPVPPTQEYYGDDRPTSPLSTMAARYNEHPPQGTDGRGYGLYGEPQSADHFEPYPPRDAAMDKPVEGATGGPRPWTPTNVPEAQGDQPSEADKTIFDAAVGLLCIRSSQW